LLWGTLAYFARKHEFMTVFLILTTIGLIFYSLDWKQKRDENSLSSWSVFNKNFESIPGTFSANEQIANMTGGAISAKRK